MADEKKPFICFKAGLSIKITPQTAQGWLALAWWMLGFLAALGLFVWAMARHPAPGQATALTIGFTLSSIVWAVSMTRWMMARSDIVDMAELLKLKQELERQKGRHR